MKTVLIQPPIEDFYITRQRVQPVGLLYLSTFLKKNNYQVKILDLLSPLKKKKIPLPEQLSYLKQYYQEDMGPLRTFSDYYHFGRTWEEIKNILQQETFDIYGISSNFTAYYQETLRTAQMIRETNRNAFIIIGGNNSRIMYRTFLDSGYIDLVLFGEGENTLLKVLQNRENLQEVENIAYREKDKITVTALKNNFSLNDSVLHFDLLDPDDYKIGKNRALSIITSKGCPYNCSYCTANINCISSYQKKELTILKEELDYNINKFQFQALNIEDENFTYDREYAAEFLKFKIANYPDLRLYFMNGLHYRDLTDDLLLLLKEANLYNLNLALVDMDNYSLLKRPFEQEKFEAVVRKAKGLGFLVTVYFIAGLPEQTSSDIQKMIHFLYDLKVVIGMSIYYPVPLTPLYEKYSKAMENITYIQMRSTALPFTPGTLTRTELVHYLRYTRLLNLSGDNEKKEPEFSTRQDKKALILETEKKLNLQEQLFFIRKYFHEHKKLLYLKKTEYSLKKYSYFFSIPEIPF